MRLKVSSNCARSALSASLLLAWRTLFMILDSVVEVAAQVVKLPRARCCCVLAPSARVAGRPVFSLSSSGGKCAIRGGGRGANLLKDPCRRLARRDAVAHGPIEIADLGIDAGDQRLDRQHRLLVGDDGPKLFDRLPQDADALGGRDHSVEALDLILRVADFAGGLDHVGGPALNVHRQLERRHADFDQAVAGRSRSG